MRNWLIRLMEGRHGVDYYSRFLSIAACILLVLSIFLDSTLLWVAALFLLILSYFRIFSKNEYKRAEENRRYLTLRSRVTSKFYSWKQRRSQGKDYRFFSCPDCHAKVRVPKGKGKIQITCPKCGIAFVRKS